MPFTSPPITMLRTAWFPPSCGTPTSRNLRDELPQLSAKTCISNRVSIRTLLVQARDEFSAVPHHDPAEQVVLGNRQPIQQDGRLSSALQGVLNRNGDLGRILVNPLIRPAAMMWGTPSCTRMMTSVTCAR